jgi:hypothetical protein
MLRLHHATTVKIVINKKNPRGLTIPTQLVQKHAEKILPGNGKAITNFNILAKTSLGHRFPIPYLDTFSIAGSRIDGLKIVFRIFRDLQTVPGVPRYTICPLECPVTSPTIRRSFQYLAASWLYLHDVVHLLCIESGLPFPCSILRHFFDYGFPDWRAQDCVSNVPRLANSTRSSAIYNLSTGMHHHALFRVTRSAVNTPERYNLTLGPSPLLVVSCSPILKRHQPLSIISHSLIVVPCPRHLPTSLWICNWQDLMLTLRHA